MFKVSVMSVVELTRESQRGMEPETRDGQMTSPK